MEMAASRECGAEMDAVLKSGGSFPAQAGRLLQTDLSGKSLCRSYSRSGSLRELDGGRVTEAESLQGEPVSGQRVNRH